MAPEQTMPAPRAAASASATLLLVCFGAAILLSAMLLFTVQPMVARMLLPRLGGSPAVWNTCMVFFQAALLIGYAYALLLTRRLTPRAQLLLHGVVCCLPLALLPMTMTGAAAPPADSSPVWWLLATLGSTVGVPFFVLATTGPLLQRWFAGTDHPRAHDPYFLYVGSNLGSLAGLLAYPLLLERLLGLTTPGGTWFPSGARWLSQSTLWSLGYAVFAVAVIGCGILMLLYRSADPVAGGLHGSGMSPAPSWRRRGRWILLAAVPSSAMLGTTQHLSTDLAAIPLLWVVPLALYLVTLMVAFSSRLRVAPRHASILLVPLVAAAAASYWSTGPELMSVRIPLHLATLLAAGLLCHGLLAADRPPADRLTEFYLLMAVGGVLGGAFNALAAPLIFDSVVEYPLVLALACLLRPADGTGSTRQARLLDLGLPLALAAAVVVLGKLPPALGLEGRLRVQLLVIGVPWLISLTFLHRRTRFTLGVVVLWLAGWLEARPWTNEHVERTFYGVHRVQRVIGPAFSTVDARGQQVIHRIESRCLVHGTTRHGSQALDPELSRIPTSYYHPSGPIGQVFGHWQRVGHPAQVAFVGLGAGTLAAYGTAGQTFTFYEIDPAVVRIAGDPLLFTYLENSAAAKRFIVGDGRRRLGEAPDGSYGMIVLDAFNSDAVPVHLLTREALALYMRKLRPGGLLAIHLTNSYLDLLQVVDAIAADLGLAGAFQRDYKKTPLQRVQQKDGSVWAVLAADRSAVQPLLEDARWRPLPRRGVPERRVLWTDDYSNLVSVLKLY